MRSSLRYLSGGVCGTVEDMIGNDRGAKFTEAQLKSFRHSNSTIDFRNGWQRVHSLFLHGFPSRAR